MLDPLQVTEIQPNGTDIRIKIRGSSDRILKISSDSLILIRHKIVNTKELQIGDEILAYGLDHVPSDMYNDSRCKKSKLVKEIKSNGKRATKTLRGKNHR